MTPEENLVRLLQMTTDAMGKPPQGGVGERANRGAERRIREREALGRPAVWDVDERGEMQVVGTGMHLDGWVDVEQYAALLNYVEDLESGIRDLIP